MAARTPDTGLYFCSASYLAVPLELNVCDLDLILPTLQKSFVLKGPLYSAISSMTCTASQSEAAQQTGLLSLSKGDRLVLSSASLVRLSVCQC